MQIKYSRWEETRRFVIIRAEDGTTNNNLYSAPFCWQIRWRNAREAIAADFCGKLPLCLVKAEVMRDRFGLTLSD